MYYTFVAQGEVMSRPSVFSFFHSSSFLNVSLTRCQSELPEGGHGCLNLFVARLPLISPLTLFSIHSPFTPIS